MKRILLLWLVLLLSFQAVAKPHKGSGKVHHIPKRIVNPVKPQAKPEHKEIHVHHHNAPNPSNLGTALTTGVIAGVTSGVTSSVIQNLLQSEEDPPPTLNHQDE